MSWAVYLDETILPFARILSVGSLFSKNISRNHNSYKHCTHCQPISAILIGTEAIAGNRIIVGWVEDSLMRFPSVTVFYELKGLGMLPIGISHCKRKRR